MEIRTVEQPLFGEFVLTSNHERERSSEITNTYKCDLV